MTRRPDPANFTDRDLRFRPSNPSRAATLSPDSVERYNTDGFLSGLDVFDSVEAAALRSYIDDLLRTVTNGNGDSYAINGYHTVCAGLWDIVTDHRIVAMVTDLLGSHAVCWGTHLFAKLPGDGREVPFHQDAVYWPFTPTLTTTVWLAIDDVDGHNAPVQFVPGSHLDGPIVHEVLEVGEQRVLGRRATGMEQRTERFSNVLHSGQISLHSDLMLHGSEANRSERRRAGLTLRYAAAEVRTMPDYDQWQESSVHVAQGDSFGLWADRPRPDGEHPGSMATALGGAGSVDAG